jgi:hypothetical protein
MRLPEAIAVTGATPSNGRSTVGEPAGPTQMATSTGESAMARPAPPSEPRHGRPLRVQLEHERLGAVGARAAMARSMLSATGLSMNPLTSTTSTGATDVSSAAAADGR